MLPPIFLLGETMDRPYFDETFMAIAKIVAQRSTCSNKIKVGAVLTTPDNFILSTGYNGSPSKQPHCDEEGCIKDINGKCQRVVHAEANCIAQAAKLGHETYNTILYSTHLPCFRCLQLCISAGIMKIYYLYLGGDDWTFNDAETVLKYAEDHRIRLSSLAHYMSRIDTILVTAQQYRNTYDSTI